MKKVGTKNWITSCGACSENKTFYIELFFWDQEYMIIAQNSWETKRCTHVWSRVRTKKRYNSSSLMNLKTLLFIPRTPGQCVICLLNATMLFDISDTWYCSCCLLSIRMYIKELIWIAVYFYRFFVAYILESLCESLKFWKYLNGIFL